MKKRALTQKQTDILNSIRYSIQTKGYPPSVRELCAATGLKSTSTIHAHLTTLERKGYIKRDSTRNRAIELIDDIATNRNLTISIPIYNDNHFVKLSFFENGYSNSSKIYNFFDSDNIIDYYPLPQKYISDNKVSIIQITNDFYSELSINKDDYIIFKHNDIPASGKIIIGKIEDKCFITYYDKDFLSLKLPDYEILGEIIGLFHWNV